MSSNLGTANLYPRTPNCVCEGGPMLHDGSCIKCGRGYMERCSRSGYMVADCGCRWCSTEKALKQAA